MKQVITAQDVPASGELRVAVGTIVTSSAREVAAGRGVRIVEVAEDQLSAVVGSSLERVDDLLVRDLGTLEVALHQLIGDLGDLIQQLLAILLGAGLLLWRDLDSGRRRATGNPGAAG